MLEWLFFLLPVAALSGWLMARRHYKQRYRPNDPAFNPAYFKGLNYLLNEQPDKAIDVFIGLLEVNSETVETHMALANLFRRRGETDRAIRIHQNLIARPTLSGHQRIQALVELGMDYMNAGVLDRAEQLFLELMQQPSPPPEAARQLVRIYQQEKNWQKAITMAKFATSDRQQDTRTMIAQFYCELADQASDKDSQQALSLLRQAQHYDPNCVRATLAQAEIYLNIGQPRKALRALKQVEQQNSAFLSEAIPLLYKSYQQTNSLEQFRIWLQQLLERHPDMTTARIMLTRVIQLQNGNQAAQNFLYRQLQHQPSVAGLYTLILLSEDAEPNLVPLIREVTTELVHKGDRYTCKNCGFTGKTLHWQCPGCSKWATIRPTEIQLSSLEKILESSQ